MEKIKKSFTRNFLPILIAAAVLLLISAVFSVLGGFGSLLNLILTPPLYVGFYSFLFKRMEDENPDISSIFSFYKSGGTWWRSFCMTNLGGIILGTALVIFVIMFVVSGVLRDVESYMFTTIIFVFLAIISINLFLFMPYLYAKAPYIGIGDALSRSFKLGLKYLFVFAAIDIVIGAVRIGFFILDIGVSSAEEFIEYAQQVGRTMQYSQSGSPLSILVDLITTAFSMWANFTAVYIIIEREKIFDGNYDYYDTAENFVDVFEKGIQNIEAKGVEAAKNAAYNIGGSYVYNQDTTVENDGGEEEKPFIEPYDFYIEADERFNDEKIIETEDIRGVDILAVLDEMNLIDDIKVNYVIRRKLNKMFRELSFEIGEYDTYSGGRSIENDFTEEIDEREFDVSVEITRNSDYEPFKLILRVNVLKEE